jgi:hypothetical protein
MELITYKQWDSQLRRIFNANIKNHGKSLSEASMRGGNLIVEMRDDEKTMFVEDNWRKELKQLYLVPKLKFDYKAWLQEQVKPYGIDLSNWSVELLPNPRPSGYPGHLPYAGQIIFATNPKNENLEIEVENVWTSDTTGEILQYSGIRLGA